jgi:hypothetical protein
MTRFLTPGILLVPALVLARSAFHFTADCPQKFLKISGKAPFEQGVVYAHNNWKGDLAFVTNNESGPTSSPTGVPDSFICCDEQLTDSSGRGKQKTSSVEPVYYPPLLTGSATEPGKIVVTFQDRSYADTHYLLFSNTGRNMRFSMLDSGRVFTFEDTLLFPGTQYQYTVTTFTRTQTFYVSAQLFIVSKEEPYVLGFTLVDADTDQPITELREGMLVSTPRHPNITASIMAKTGHSPSVRFRLNGKERVEDLYPFSFFYDSEGDYKPGKLEPGDYELEATPYSQHHAQGIEGQSLKIHFTVDQYDSSLVIESFTLVDPATGQDIQQLSDGNVITGKGAPNIRANTRSNTGSVVFDLNGKRRVENVAPYAYFYDVGGVYRRGNLQDGVYILEATAYSGNNGTGWRGTTKSIQFTVIKQSTASLKLYPNPAHSVTSVEVSGTPNNNLSIDIINERSSERSNVCRDVLDDDGFLQKTLNLSAFSPGDYVIIVTTGATTTTRRLRIMR